MAFRIHQSFLLSEGTGCKAVPLFPFNRFVCLIFMMNKKKIVYERTKDLKRPNIKNLFVDVTCLFAFLINVPCFTFFCLIPCRPLS